MYSPPPSQQHGNPNNNDWGKWAGVIGVGVLAVGVLYELFGQKKKVFISYDHSEDANYRRLLEAWDANSKFKFEFDHMSPRQAINSRSAATVKASLTSMMKRANYLLMIVGRRRIAAHGWPGRSIRRTT
jgi:hypothetical protein